MFLIVIINFFEVLAAIIGSVYSFKYHKERGSRYLIYFLWLTVFVEVFFGWLPYFIQENEFFHYLRGTILERNSWIYNIEVIIKFLFYSYFFLSYIKNKKMRKTLNYGMIFFFITTIINLIFSNIFFETISSYTYITGSILLMISIVFYFMEIMNTDEILYFKKTLPFYIAVGALLFHLSMTPLFIYSRYYSNSRSPEYVSIYRLILTLANVFMYSCYSIGFLVCFKSNDKTIRGK